jgi:hypothetical protein
MSFLNLSLLRLPGAVGNLTYSAFFSFFDMGRPVPSSLRASTLFPRASTLSAFDLASCVSPRADES